MSKPLQLAERCAKLSYESCALTDINSISGAVDFQKACNTTCRCGHSKNVHNKNCAKCDCLKFDKFQIKPILGTEFFTSVDSKITVLAKNLKGWKNLVKATSRANEVDTLIKDKATLPTHLIGGFASDLIAISGGIGSDLANEIFEDYKSAYKAISEEAVKSFVKKDWVEKCCLLVNQYRDIFGKNFFINIQLFNSINSPAATIVAAGLRYISKRTGVPCVATTDSYYPSFDDAIDQRVLLCSDFETTHNNLDYKINQSNEIGLTSFLNSSRFYITELEELQKHHTEAELQLAADISSQCEIYDITSKPIVPRFDCPNGKSEEEYLRELCNIGWQRKIIPRIKQERLQEYKQRLEMELGVIYKAKILTPYFLIVQDYCNWFKQQGWLMGPGRGSGAGSLVSYLTNITELDPIEDGLIFERFYNDGRNTEDRVSLPDIDCDFMVSKREAAITYVENKYGPKRVCQMVTFARMQGRSSLRDVLRARDECSFDEINKITKPIPDEAAISDELQLMREAGQDPSIIMWALENEAKALKEWAYLDEDGIIQGPKKIDFEQAIRLEGTKRSRGKHAAGVIIAANDLENICPMVYDGKTGKKIAAMEMNALEAMGAIKFDFLGVAALDKVFAVQQELCGEEC